MTIHFLNDREGGIKKRAFRPFIARLRKAIVCKQGVLNVIFVNDFSIQALNKRYLKKDKPTDVLSFNYETKNMPSDLIGEVYISIETAKRQAKTFKHSFVEELNKLFVHGVLHIYGYDHEKNEDYKVMHALECKILGKDMT